MPVQLSQNLKSQEKIRMLILALHFVHEDKPKWSAYIQKWNAKINFQKIIVLFPLAQ